MADRPILFSATMVRALLDGRKTQTRRMLNPQPESFPIDDAGTPCNVGCMQVDGETVPRVWLGSDRAGVLTTQKLRFAVGDRLWVKETWAVASVFTDVVEVRYRASERRAHSEFVEQVPIERAEKYSPTWPTWKPSIFMQRWASRLTLTVTDVRVQRLQDISDEDAIAEGLIKMPSTVHMSRWGVDDSKPETHRYNPGNAYAVLWNSINGAGSWAANPWIVAVTFDVRKGNIDG